MAQVVTPTETPEVIPFQHEDDETAYVRTLYEQALVDIHPEFDDNTILSIAMMVVNNTRYGVKYSPEMENLINELNQEIRNARS